MNFSDERQQFTLGAPQAVWSKILDSAGNEWNGPGATLPDRVHGRQEVDMPAHSIAVYRTEHREVLREQVQAQAAESVAQELSDAYPQHNI
jgi:hypothetical protein